MNNAHRYLKDHQSEGVVGIPQPWHSERTLMQRVGQMLLGADHGGNSHGGIVDGNT